MLAVLGLKPAALEALVAGTNKRLKLDAASGMTVSLVNTWDAFVVSGKPESLSALVSAIEKESVSPDEPQGRVPFSKRKPVVTTSFLRVTGTSLLGQPPLCVR
jgi:malonyl CoA-acyl carrier protein transacylase